MDPTAQQKTANETSGTPSSWPGALGIFKFSGSAVMHSIIPLTVLLVLSVIISMIINLHFAKGSIGARLICELLSVAISTFSVSGLYWLLLAGVRREPVSIRAALQHAAKSFGNMLLFIVMISMALIAGTILLFVPALIITFYILPRLSLTYYFIVDDRTHMNVFDAMSASWKATTGNLGKVWGIIGVTFLFVLLCIIIIGVPFLIIYAAATAVLYNYLLAHPSSASSTSVQATTTGEAAIPQAS